MTLIISWIGVDSKKNGGSVATIYIASDSRYSWGKANVYDYGIKVFGCAKHPEIFGFCGDVVFPSLVLGQLLPQIDAGLLISPLDNGLSKNKKIYKYIQTSFDLYPKNLLNGTFTILHATRYGNEFKCFKTEYLSHGQLLNDEIILPKISTKIYSGGSGKKDFDENWKKWEKTSHNNYGTSRGVYHCLSDTLKNIKDPSTGGLPQILGLYRTGNARLFGIITNEKKYIYGKESDEYINSLSIEWRNDNFERMDPISLKLIDGAQRQPL